MLFRQRQVKPDISSCLNCHKPFTQDIERFCSSCGQLRTDGRVRFIDFVRDAFQDVFNLDGRIWLTLRDLLIPGKLTRLFFAGKHNSYYKPIRLFFSLMVIHFAALGFRLNTLMQDDQGINLDGIIRRETSEAVKTKQILDSIRITLAPNASLHRELDSLESRLDIRKTLLDSTTITLLDFPDLKLDQKFKIAAIDFQDTSLSVIAEKYHLRGFNKFYISQIIKVQRNPNGAFRYLMGNLVWMVLMMIPALALFMKLLYILSRKFYVEHLVFQYHFHGFAFLTMGCVFILDIAPETYGLAFLLILFYFYAALKLYYRQGIFKTFAKFVLINLAYLFFLGIFISITVLFSLILF